MMKDFITPTSFDLTKVLHGHVRVETRSRWTGKVIDSQEKDNLVTSAIQKLLYACAWYQTNGLSSWFTPIYEKALGSLVLFGDTLTESADNIYFPNKPPIAIAPYGSDNSASGGSLNPAESGAISNGYTNVWDFATSQANGTIASVARSNFLLKGYGFQGNYVNFSLGLSTGTYPNVYFIGYDETNKYLFFTASVNSTIWGIPFSTTGIYKVKKDLEKIDLENSSMVFRRASLVKSLSGSEGTTEAYLYAYDRWKNEFVYIDANKVHHIAMDGTHTEETLSNTGSYNRFAVTENYYWRSGGSSSTKVYRITKTNLADITEYTVQDSGATPLAVYGNDVVVTGKSGYFDTQNILYPDGTIVRKTGQNNVYYSNGSPYDVGLFTGGRSSSANELRLRCNYLGTIANLDSPVTKTSSQTMKITYTLTEA